MKNKTLKQSLIMLINVSIHQQCHQLHHKKSHQHNFDEPCPVEKELFDAISIVENFVNML
jgi:hypothetical protein